MGVWSGKKSKSGKTVTEWQKSWKAMTTTTKDSLKELKSGADSNGYTGLSGQITADMKTLDSMDKEINSLLKKRQGSYFTDKDQQRLQELIQAKGEIEIKYHLVESDGGGGFQTIQDKVRAAAARAQARGESVGTDVYENAIVAAGQGMATVNAQIDAQYDKEYSLIQLMEDGAEKQAALDALNTRYLNDRKEAATQYAQTLAGLVMPVWNTPEIQQAGEQVDQLTQLMREYQLATDDKQRSGILSQMNELTAGMDEGALTEYYSMLTQIQSLMDSGLSAEEVKNLFPEIDLTTEMAQMAAIQEFLKNPPNGLENLEEMLGEALPEEVLTIATDLDMEGAKARWAEFAANPGAITTEAVIKGFANNTDSLTNQPKIEAFISKYTEVPEGADKASLTVDGLIGYIAMYAEKTGGADTSGLTPENVTAMVAAYRELAGGADTSTLTPNQIVARVKEYLEKSGVDTSQLTPDTITAFVMAYEEVNGCARTNELTPSDVTALVVGYMDAQKIDISKLTQPQIIGLVNAFSEATGCDKSQLPQNLTAYITKYDDPHRRG